MSKDSDINVGSIEEDIKQLKDLIKDRQSFLTGYEENDEIYLKDIKAINNLINDYQRQRQINEEHQKINGELREKVKELEIDLTTVYLKGVEDGKDKYEQKIKVK